MIMSVSDLKKSLFAVALVMFTGACGRARELARRSIDYDDSDYYDWIETHGDGKMTNYPGTEMWYVDSTRPACYPAEESRYNQHYWYHPRNTSSGSTGVWFMITELLGDELDRSGNPKTLPGPALEGLTACSKLGVGVTLASILSEGERQMITHTITHTHSSEEDEHWINLRRDVSEWGSENGDDADWTDKNKWIWQSSGKAAEYTKWADGMPNRAFPSPDDFSASDYWMHQDDPFYVKQCVSFTKNGWYDKSCGDELEYAICEFECPKIEKPSNPESCSCSNGVPTEGEKCPVEKTDHCSSCSKGYFLTDNNSCEKTRILRRPDLKILNATQSADKFHTVDQVFSGTGSEWFSDLNENKIYAEFNDAHRAVSFRIKWWYTGGAKQFTLKLFFDGGWSSVLGPENAITDKGYNNWTKFIAEPFSGGEHKLTGFELLMSEGRKGQKIHIGIREIEIEVLERH